MASAFKGQVIITGAGGGIGSTLAFGLASVGYAVHCVDLDRAAVERVAEEITARGGSAGAYGGVNLADYAAVEALMVTQLGDIGALSGVVCCAGGTKGHYASFLEITPQAWSAMLSRNLDTAFNTGSVFGRTLAAQGHGSIVFISSTAAARVSPGLAHYATAKSAVEQLARAMALELGSFGVRVNCVAPGPTRTDAARAKLDEMLAAGEFQRYPLRRPVETAEIVGAVAYLLSANASCTTGTVITVDGGSLLA